MTTGIPSTVKVAIVAGLFVLAVGADVQCPGTLEAQRTSLASLQAQIDALEAELDDAPFVVDSNGVTLGPVVSGEFAPHAAAELRLAEWLHLAEESRRARQCGSGARG